MARFQIIVISQWNRREREKKKEENRVSITRIGTLHKFSIARIPFLAAENMKSSSSNSILRQDCICLSLCQPLLLLSSYYFYITYADLLISYLVSAPVDPFIAFSIHSPFHPSQVIRRRHTNPGTPSISVKWSRSCNYMHFSSNSLSLSLPCFLIPQTRVASQPRKRGFGIAQTTRIPTVLSSFPSSPAAKPRLSAKLSPLSPLFPNSRDITRLNFESGYPPPAWLKPKGGISTREHRLNLPRFWAA